MRVVVRIRTSPGKQISRSRRPNRRLAWMAASLCWPLALFCYFVCGWRWSFDLAWTERFLVSDGVLFHWQVWCLAAGLMHFIAARLTRYAGPIEQIERKPAKARAVERVETRLPISIREAEHAGRA